MSLQRDLKAASVLRFLASGALNTLVGLGIIAIGLALGLEANAANFVGYSVAFALAYLVQRGWVYSGRRGHPVRFMMAAGLSYAANLIVLNALLFTGALPILAQLGGMVTYTMSSLLLSSLWVFTQRTSPRTGVEIIAPLPRAGAAPDGGTEARPPASC